MHTPLPYLILFKSRLSNSPGGGIGRRKGLKILESNLVPVRLRPWANETFLTSFFIMLILASCGKIPAPSVITPELSEKSHKVTMVTIHQHIQTF